VSLLKQILLVPAAVLLLFGAEEIYHALRGSQEATLSCDQFAQARPSSPRVRVTGCEIDYGGAAYRETDGRLEELFLPARPAGKGPAPIVVAVHDPAALAVAQTVLGSGRSATPDQSIAVMRKVVDVVKVSNEIDGLVRAGIIERFRSRRILSGFSTPVAADASVIDLHGTPDFMKPSLALAAGLLVAVLPLLPSRPPRRRPQHAEASMPANDQDDREIGNTVETTGALDPLLKYAHDEYFPETPEADRRVVEPPPSRARELPLSVTLPGLLLLNLDVSSGPEAIETAPPLGARPEVVTILRGVIPNLEMDDSGRRLTRSDGSVKLDLGSGNPVPTVVIEARGEAGVALVKEVLLMTGWRAFAPKTGLFVSVDDLEALAALAGSDEVRP
jgi:hypothetical protein